MSAQRHESRIPRIDPRARQGVTLVELMIVVVVIAVMAGAFGSSVRRTVLEQRAAAASREIVRMARDARLSASVLRVAHALRIDPETGIVRILRAPTNSCLNTNWVSLDLQCASPAMNSGRLMGTECVSVDFTEPPWSYQGSPTLRLRELMPSTATPPGDDTQSNMLRTICYSPSGVVYHSQGTAVLTTANAVNGAGSLGGGFVFQLDMLRPGESEPTDLIPRQVLVPLTGLAKVIR